MNEAEELSSGSDRSTPPQTPELLLTTTRFVLRPVADSDLLDVGRMYADPAVVAGYPGGRTLTLGEIRRGIAYWRKQWSEHGHSVFVIRERIGGAFVGTAGLRPTDAKGVAELGAVIDRNWWSRGVATEVGAALLMWGFDVLALDRVVMPDVSNPTSAHLIEKAGGRITARNSNTTSWEVEPGAFRTARDANVDR